MSLNDWARQWGVAADAMLDLRRLLLAQSDAPPPPTAAGKSEAYVQSEVRLEAARHGLRMWRNNVGVMETDTGSYVRFGLANDSAAVNAKLKSADLIGVRPVLIGPQHVGHTVGQFVSREVKRPGWKYAGTEREAAQLAWVKLIVSLGGDASFCTGTGSF